MVNISFPGVHNEDFSGEIPLLSKQQGPGIPRPVHGSVRSRVNERAGLLPISSTPLLWRKPALLFECPGQGGGTTVPENAGQ